MEDHEVEIENSIDPNESYHYVMSPDELNVLYVPCGHMPRSKADEWCTHLMKKITSQYDYKLLIIPTFS